MVRAFSLNYGSADSLILNSGVSLLRPVAARLLAIGLVDIDMVGEVFTMVFCDFDRLLLFSSLGRPSLSFLL